MKIEIDVGEPRDFDAGDGATVVVGTVREDLSGEREIEEDPSVSFTLQATGSKGKTVEPRTYKEFWFVADTPEVECGGIRFRSLLMTPRYRSKKSPVELLAKGREVVVNAIWRRDGEGWDAPSVEAARAGTIDVEGVIIAKVTKAEGQ